jgi:hypothetical protein
MRLSLELEGKKIPAHMTRANLFLLILDLKSIFKKNKIDFRSFLANFKDFFEINAAKKWF